MLSKQVVFKELTLFDYFFLVITTLTLPLIFIQQFTFSFTQHLGYLFGGYYFLIWLLFLLEFLIRLFLSRSKISYLKQKWIEIIIILFPFMLFFLSIEFFEVSILVLIYRLTNIFSHIHLRSFLKTLVLSVVIVSLSTKLILVFEASYPQSRIHSLSDALWWSTVGISTIGIGNIVPISFEGKILTILLMVSGIILFGLFTANIASFFTEKDVKKDINKELHDIEKDLSTIDEKLEKQISNEDVLLEGKLSEINTKLAALEEKK